jgi:hypothetical protein
MKFKRLVIMMILGILSLGMISGCTGIRNLVVEDSLKNTKGAQDPKKVEAFENRFTQVLDDIDKKDDYKKIPLEGDDAKWFIQQTFKLWDNKQSKKQYVQNGTNKFPKYKETFEYLADEFTK